MLKRLRERAGSEKGFTLIELLVVMLILGILAAIAIPAFLNQRQKASDAQIKSTLRTAATAMETYSTDNGGSYAGASGTILNGYEGTIPTSYKVTYPGGFFSYTVTAPAASDGVTYSISRVVNGAVTGQCDKPGTGGCPPGSGSTSTWTG
jgi:type IV pilus assembly protein PilA